MDESCWTQGSSLVNGYSITEYTWLLQPSHFHFSLHYSCHHKHPPQGAPLVNGCSLTEFTWLIQSFSPRSINPRESSPELIHVTNRGSVFHFHTSCPSSLHLSFLCKSSPVNRIRFSIHVTTANTLLTTISRESSPELWTMNCLFNVYCYSTVYINCSSIPLSPSSSSLLPFTFPSETFFSFSKVEKSTETQSPELLENCHSTTWLVNVFFTTTTSGELNLLKQSVVLDFNLTLI